MTSAHDQTGLAYIEEDVIMPWVTWETKTEEDFVASRKEGKVVYRDTDYALVTLVGSREMTPQRMPDWFKKCEENIANGRMPASWLESYKRSYEAYKKGHELPVEGTPIKGWGVASGAMQANLIRVGIRTVEQLAVATDEAMANIGMGAREYKHRAQAWLKQNQEKASLAVEMAAVKLENEQLKGNLDALEKKFSELKAELKAKK